MSGNKKLKTNPHERVRPIGEPREEPIRRELLESEITRMREDLEALLDNEDQIENKKKEAAKNFASQLETNKLLMGDLRRKIKARFVDDAVMVQEFLTKSNEVIRIRIDTQEQIGARTAKPAELQEDMFPPGTASGPAPEGQPDAAEVEEFTSEFAGDAT